MREGALGDRVRVMLAQPDARGRLRVVEALRDRYELMPLGPGEDPVRAVRSQRPALVLLEVPRAQSGNTLRACRAIKTDAGTPPRVALLDLRGRLSHPRNAVEGCLADGYLGRELASAELAGFVADVLAGKRPIIEGERRRRGLLGRFLDR